MYEKSYEFYSKLVYILPSGYIPLPPLIVWVITNKCNLLCKMCSFYGENPQMPDSNNNLSIEEIKSIIDDIKQCYNYYPYKPYIGIIGGEPFVHPHIFEILRYLKDNGFKYAISTNLALLNNEKIEKLLDIGLNDLRISLDGPEKIHDLIRNVPDTFKKVMNNLNIIRSHKKGKNIPIRFNCVICPQNVEYLEEMPAIAKKYNASLSFQHLMFIDEKHNKLNSFITQKLLGEELHMGATSMRLTKIQVEIAKVSITKMILNANRLNVKTSFAPNLSIDEFDEYYFNLETYTHSNKCQWPWGSARIMPSGNLSSCLYNYGNLKNDSFKNIWNGERAKKFRNVLKESKLFPGCIRCCKI